MLEFRHPRAWFYSNLLLELVWTGFGVVKVLDGAGLVWLALWLALPVLAGTNAVLSLLPYARVSRESLTFTSLLRPVPPCFRPRRVIQWSSVQGARRKSWGIVELTICGGKRVKLRLDHVADAQRMTFLAALEQRLGPLPVPPARV